MKKHDNSKLKAKLDLRRYFLRKYHAGNSIDVVDCCAGNQVIWNILRREFSVSSYLAIDVKSKINVLNMKSERFLCQNGWTQNVIDIDTYGSPWKHYLSLLPNLPGPATVFLTFGQTLMGTDDILSESLGLPKSVPDGLRVKTVPISISHVLTRCYDYYITIVEAMESACKGHVWYIGLRLQK